MIKLLTIASLVFLLLCINACNNLKQNNWELTYIKMDNSFGNIQIKIGTKDCLYEAETGRTTENAKIKWESTSEKLQTLFNKIEAHQLQKGTLSAKTDELEKQFEILEFSQNGKVVYTLQKNRQTKEMMQHFNEAVILMRTFSMEQQGWKF